MRIDLALVDAHLTCSMGEGHRKIKEGAVFVNGEKVTDVKQIVTKGDQLKCGRKVWTVGVPQPGRRMTHDETMEYVFDKYADCFRLLDDS